MPIPVRTIPPYVRSYDWEDEQNPLPLYRQPHALVRMSMSLPVVGRRIRSRSMGSRVSTAEQDVVPHNTSHGSRWAEFMEATGAPRPRVLTQEERDRATAIYAEYDRKREENPQPAEQPLPPRARREQTQSWLKTKLMRNAFIPLFFRIFVLAMSIIALGLSAKILHVFRKDHIVDRNPDCKESPSTYMAIDIAALAIIYTSYIAWDEFTAKPIGLRPPSSKLKLLLLDLLFVAFMSANVSLAWEALWSDSFPCGGGGRNSCPSEGSGICEVQAALVAVLMIAIIAWLSTFIVSLYRLVFVVEAQREIA